MLWRDSLSKLEAVTRQAMLGGGEKAIEKQHARGKLTARERLEILLDPGSFNEIDMFIRGHGEGSSWGEGAVTGFGLIDGRRVYVYAQDFTVAGGSLGEAGAKKIFKVMDMAIRVGAPIIGLVDSGGARIQEGLGHYGMIFGRNVLASGVVPQINVVLGPCAGGAAYSPALADFVFMVDGLSKMFIAGPKVIEAATGEKVSPESLGGGRVHAELSGTAHFLFQDEGGCLRGVRELLGYLPSSSHERLPRVYSPDEPGRATPEIQDIVPDDPYMAYDMKAVIRCVLDEGRFLEVQECFARNMIVGFGRLGGETVGVVANQPSHLAGCIDVNAADKAARFILFCDAFNIPLLTLVDCPGYLPGVSQEHAGIIRHGAKMIYAYSEATVPKVTLVVRKVYGGAMSGMAVSKYVGTDLTYVLPTAEIAIMGPEAAANVIFAEEISAAPDPEKVRLDKIREYRERFASPFVAAEQGWVDGIVPPEGLRRQLASGLRALLGKREARPPKKHGVIPL